MYKTYSFLVGVMLAFMTLSYSILTSATGNFAGFVIAHVVGLGGSLLVFLATKTKYTRLKGIPFIFLFGGFTGYFSVFFINICFQELGATLTLILSMCGQILASTLIDHFGLLGMEQFPFDKKKLIGISFMLAGIALIVIN